MRGSGFAGGLFGSMLGELLTHPERFREIDIDQYLNQKRLRVNVVVFNEPPRYEIYVEVPPGVSPDQIEVKVLNDTVTLSAKRPDPIEAGAHQVLTREWGADEYYRTIQLPTNVLEDSTQAEYVNGVLKITLNQPTKPQARKVEVKTA